jgi:ABC-2 type transport system permease protein
MQLEQLRQNLARLSPNTLFQEATLAILMPKVRTLGPILMRDLIGMLPNPLPFTESLVLIWPQVAGLLALTAVCFAIAYVRFMTQEIRAL